MKSPELKDLHAGVSLNENYNNNWGQQYGTSFNTYTNIAVPVQIIISRAVHIVNITNKKQWRQDIY
jgi:hypothetical protein